MTTKPASKWKIAAGLGLACAVCCASLLLPLFFGAAGAGLAGAAASGMLGVSWAEMACIVILTVLAGGTILLLLRAREERRRAAECACVAEGLSCTVGGDCNPAPR
jgi:hypothetical protein